MNRLRHLLTCVLVCTLTSCQSVRESAANAMRDYRGPVVELNGGWRDGGPWAGIRLSPWSRPARGPSLAEAAETYAILTSPAGSSGKTPVPPAP